MLAVLPVAPPVATQPPAPISLPNPISLKPTGATSHLTIFDSLRGVAALLVCVFHFTTGAVSTFAHPVTRFIGHRGYVGVEIFFVISGFIIPYALHRSRYTWRQLGSFLLKRFVRIAPPAYASIVLFILLDFIMQCLQGHTTVAEYGRGLLSARLLHNIFFTVPFTTYTWYNSIFWTLSIEFTFYLVLGIAYPVLEKSRFGLLLLGLLLAASSYLPGMPAQSLFSYSTLFTMGIAAWQYFEKKITPAYFLFLLLVFSAIGVQQLTPVPVLAGLATVAAILYLRVEHLATTFLGKISYSLYLTHVFVGFSLSYWISTMLPTVNLATTTAVILLCIAAAIVGATLFYRYIETPFVRLANRLPRVFRVLTSYSPASTSIPGAAAGISWQPAVARVIPDQMLPARTTASTHPYPVLEIALDN